MIGDMTFNDISKSFSSRPVLKKVSGSVTSGELLCVKGDNGSGKSTLLSILAGDLTPDSGEVVGSHEGIVVRKENPPFLPQSSQVATNLSVADHLIKAPNTNCLAKLSFLFANKVKTRELQLPEALNALDSVGLGKYVHTPAGHLSEGHRRLLLICSLLQERSTSHPHLVLLDEPLAALSPESQNRVTRLIANRLASGWSFIVSEHEPLIDTISSNELVLDLS